MKKLKTAAFFLILLISSFFSFALTYEEFRDSYNFSYKTGAINITNISINNCIICDNLTVMLSLNNEPGDYNIYGFFDNQTSTISEYFFDENSTLKLTFYPPFDSNLSELIIKITKNNELVYFSNATLLNISKINFKSNSLTAINNTNEDGKLVITLAIKVISSGDYLVTSYLSAADEVFIKKQNETITLEKNISISFDPGIDGDFTLFRVELNQISFYPGYKTNNYSFSKIKFSNDTIKNFNLIINITNKDNLTIIAYLFDAFSNYITQTSSANNIIVFNGSEINSSGINGPYLVQAFVDGKKYAYETGYYNYSDFQDIEPKDDSIITTLSKKTKNLIGAVSGFFASQNVNESISDGEAVNHSTKEESDNFDAAETLMERLNPAKKDGVLQNPEMKTGFLQNLLTGNAVFKENEGSYGGRNYLVYLILLIMAIASIIGISVFIRKRNH